MITAEAKAQHRELGRDFEVAQWLGVNRANKRKVASDIAKLREKLKS